MGYVRLLAPGRRDVREVVREGWEDLKRMFSEGVRRRGEEYLMEGFVVPVEVGRDRAVFSSSGTYLPSYRIVLQMDGEALTAECTCPYGGPCKHIYASLKLLVAEGGKGVREILMGMEKEDLVELLIDSMPPSLRMGMMEDPWDALENLRETGELSTVVYVLPFVPKKLSPEETFRFLSSLLETLWEMELPCPATLSITVRVLLRTAKDKVATLLRLYELFADKDCLQPLYAAGELLDDGERLRAAEEGVPYDILKNEGWEMPPSIRFSTADACTDYLIAHGEALTDEEIRRIAEDCIGKFGLFTPLVLLYIRAGGDENLALQLLGRNPKASLLLTLRPHVSPGLHAALMNLLRERAPDEYARYLCDIGRAKELYEVVDEVDREVLIDLIVRCAGDVGEWAIPILREEIFRLAAGRRWSKYPFVAELLKALRRISYSEYSDIMRELKERFGRKRRLMEVLRDVEG